MRVITADYHRNGSGEGFYVGLVETTDDHGKVRRLLVTAFPEYTEAGDITLENVWQRIAVIDPDQASIGNVFMHPNETHKGDNAWRGGSMMEAVRDMVNSLESRWDFREWERDLTDAEQ